MKSLALIVVVVSFGMSQESARDSLVLPEQTLEQLLGEEPVEGVLPDDVDDLLDLHENPLDLNKASLRDLQRIPALTPLLAYRILSARSRRPFSRVGDLLIVEGMTEDVYQDVVPFVTVGQGPEKRMSARIRSRVKRDLNENRGFRDGAYEGTREKTLHYLDVGLGIGKDISVQGRLQSEKDPGEPMTSAFMSGYLEAETPLMKVVVGDMKVETNRRLLLGRSSVSRAVDASVSRRSFLKGYRSSDESTYFRGVGLEVALGGGIVIGGFYSNRPMHGTVSDDGIVSPVSDGGLFRTPIEQSKRNVSRERASGVSLSLSIHSMLTLSASVCHVRFLHPMSIDGTGSSVVRDVAGASLGAWFNIGNITGTGEVAAMRGGGRAGSGSLLLEPTNALRAGFAGNVFDLSYFSPLGPGRNVRSEIDLQVWTEIRPVEEWKTATSWLYTRYPMGRDGDGFSEEVKTFRMSSSARLSPGTEIAVEYSFRQSATTVQRTNEYGLPALQAATVGRHHVRGTLVVGAGRPLQWKSRVEVVGLGDDGGGGVLVSHQWRWRVSKSVLVEAKLMLFGTASYDARLYVTEPDVPGAFASRAVFGDGTRAAVLVRTHPFAGLEVSCSYHAEIKDGQRSLGSGRDETPGDHRSTAGIQVDLRF